MTPHARRTALSSLTACSLLALAACSSNATSTGGGSSTTAGKAAANSAPVVWWVPGPDTVEGTSKKIADTFTQQTGIKVDMQQYPWDGYTTKVTTAITSGQGPDIVEFGNTDAPTLGASGAFLPWDTAAFNQIGGRGQFIPAAIDSYTPKGQKPNSIPFATGVWCLLYNKAMFTAAGVQPPKTWTEFNSVAKKLSHPTKGVYAVAIAAGTSGAMNTWAWIIGQQNGVPYYTADGKPKVDTPAMVNAMAGLLRWVYPEQVMSPDVVADNFNGDNALLTNGKAAMDITQNPQAAIDHPDKYGVSYIPLPETTPPGGHQVMSHVAGVNNAIFKSTKNMANTMAFMKYLSGDTAQVMEGKYALPATSSALKDPFFQTPSMRAYGTILSKYAAATPLNSTSTQLLNGVGDALVKLYQGTASSKHVDPAAISAALAKTEQTVIAAG